MSAPSDAHEAAAAASEPAMTPADPATLPSSDCSVCAHAQAAAIDAGLLSGSSIRDTASQYGLSRSAIQRHRAKHLSAAAISEPPADGERKPLRIVDVHASLTDLVDRLERGIEGASRARKTTAVVAATRELRSSLETIAKLQATPEFARAASAEALQGYVNSVGVDFLVAMIDFATCAATGRGVRGGYDEWSTALAEVLRDCLLVAEVDLDIDGARHLFRSVDTTPLERLRERDALAATERMEREVQRRVNAELRRRENQQRPAIEATSAPVRAIEGTAPWSI